MSRQFEGFSRELPQFLSALAADNTKAWFDAHRGDYQRLYLEPAKRFVDAVGERTAKWRPVVHAEARVNGSIMRVNRDTRFSANKTPYKDHLDMMFTVGGSKYDRTRPAYMMRVRSDVLMLGGGLHGFAKEQLEQFRKAVVDEKLGKALESTVKQLDKAGFPPLGGTHYKRVPRGCDPDHPRSAWLLHNGLHTGTTSELPDELFDERAVDYVIAVFRPLQPLVVWLDEAVATN